MISNCARRLGGSPAAHYPHPKPNLATHTGAKENDTTTGKAHSFKNKGCAEERRTDQVIFHIASVRSRKFSVSCPPSTGQMAPGDHERGGL
jgi:hypothetical protein